MIPHELTKLSKGNLVLIQCITGETKHLNDFDFLQITIKWNIFTESHQAGIAWVILESLVVEETMKAPDYQKNNSKCAVSLHGLCLSNWKNGIFNSIITPTPQDSNCVEA